MSPKTCDHTRPNNTLPVIPFDSAEAAWFWFIRCQKLRNEGARSSEFVRSSSRPCDPDDLYRTAKTLHHKNRLNNEHLRVMADYGIMECPPDPRQSSQKQAAFVWSDAMDRMSGILCKKGIVVPPHTASDSPKNSHD